jgi:hypothetical protein
MLLDAPIVGRRLQDRRPTEQFTARTDPTAKYIAQTLGKSKTMEQLAPVLTSPDRLQHLINTFLPGVGEMALTAGQIALPRGATKTGVESQGERFIRTPGSFSSSSGSRRRRKLLCMAEGLINGLKTLRCAPLC